MRLLEGNPAILVVQRLFERGRPEARDCLLAALDGKREIQLSRSSLRLLWTLAGWSDDVPTPPHVEGQSDEEREKVRIEAAKGWVSSIFERIRKGEKVRLRRMEVSKPFDARRPGPRWIRRL